MKFLLFDWSAIKLQEYGLYFGKQSFYDLIKSIGGEWNDTKERPIVCMMKALDYSGIYWAVPIGNWAHRSEEAKARIKRFMSLPDDDLRSCYYHVGKTDIKSIFFISDVIPIIDKYLEREYLIILSVIIAKKEQNRLIDKGKF